MMMGWEPLIKTNIVKYRISGGVGLSNGHLSLLNGHPDDLKPCCHHRGICDSQ